MEYNDKELLDMKLGGLTMRDMGAMSFLGWLAGKLNGAPSYKAETQELLMAVSRPPMSSYMSEAEKIRLVRKLLVLGVQL